MGPLLYTGPAMVAPTLEMAVSQAVEKTPEMAVSQAAEKALEKAVVQS